jgi:protocatechuate 4,5-dioxygenase, beta chain
LPSAARCYEFGQAIGRAVASYPSGERVVVIGTGGLSHQLDGERAGFINKEFDRKFMASMVTDPSWATRYSTVELVQQTGSQGIELILWLTARAVLGGGDVGVREVAATYHVPISNTAAGMMLLEPAG